ncbi:peptidase S1 and S6 chymotrypsin/Hap [Planctopirus limnophila DSM 3776]|uniref:Peptidase S1 and S6 chymotrypsin/Hap n=1 Tax=Planctopirus limnophila (strain ATCC 43296 / DSM 3776 / IFAM 1008 / Mu 290) TaxID=521674 RepID=D5SWF6_PLAL2|nr:trypsin-like peptidase domain-containing protein [Planctopirus limnophila]ADG69549.1 peptidase S1 and S6 chymotrypsin/Hap [Planctopirus limnophila DSM 3776]
MMTRVIFASFISALAASVLTAWWLQPSTFEAHGLAVAQDRGARFKSTPYSEEDEANQPKVKPIYMADGLTPEEAVNIAVYQAANRSVVNITTKAVQSGRFSLLELQSEGSGSGSIIDKAGHVLTNNHVVEGATQISVTLYSGESFDATIVGADPVNDIAILKLEAPEDQLYPVEFGDSRKLRAGMRVFALGNPFGLERTLTTGIISNLNRSLQIHGNRTIRSIIQIDAAINPGNSGGPLLDAHGKLIGINTAIATTSGQSAGVGFAIPVNLVTRVVPQLLAYGKVVRPEVGITKVFETEKGLLIAQMKPGGPAERAGLRGPKVVRARRGPFISESVDRAAADRIMAVDGRKISTADDFLGYVEDKKPGDVVRLTIVRDGQEIEVPLTLTTTDPLGERTP